ncbi:AAA family ATPase [Rhodoferax sp.]|uniref:bifunctional aminoglycoside phosphotransferase/ATP-binding protein n=1 Tax=Rhodoferax sp. TaxID=50421 RepID=UPI00276A58BF|nr:AAA family ATPase [Rhodoferax sp.]
MHQPVASTESGIMVFVDQTLPALIRALLEPRRYPHGVQRVELVQTHISWVLLAGDFAYKIKKPLKLPFLDFSTLAQRERYCLDELRLNSRYAPDIYLGVVAIVNTSQGPQFAGRGEPIEYAVKMRRFDEAGRLDRVCARGELRPAHISDLADSVAAFHEAAATAPMASRFGLPQQVMTPARDNFDDLLQRLPGAGPRARLVALQDWTEAQFKHLSPLMDARKQAGRVRECHGDLHLGNLVLLEGRVRMFDCIEFNDDLRWIDVASEIAFTYVDLLAHGQSGLADWFVDEILSRGGDYDAALLLRFYAVYRAMVRAKVAAIRMNQTQGDDSEAVAHIALAERIIAAPPVRLLITHGLSGCGKTIASSQLLQSDPEASSLRLRADVERRRLFGLAGTACSGSTLNTGIYAPGTHARTYAHLRELADPLLRAGWSVIVDATFLKRADRDAFGALARQTGAAFAILAPQATSAQLRERILARANLGNDASEATLDVLAQQVRMIEPLAPEEGPVIRGFQDHRIDRQVAPSNQSPQRG